METSTTYLVPDDEIRVIARWGGIEPVTISDAPAGEYRTRNSLYTVADEPGRLWVSRNSEPFQPTHRVCIVTAGAERHLVASGPSGDFVTSRIAG